MDGLGGRPSRGQCCQVVSVLPGRTGRRSLFIFLLLLCRNGDSQLFDKVRGHDIKLLRYLSVRYICDLMVENKKVKFGLK